MPVIRMCFIDTRQKTSLLVAGGSHIPTRYPNGLAAELAPAEFYETEDAEQCISYAELISESVKRSSKG